jgi:hypothetical protein
MISASSDRILQIDVAGCKVFPQFNQVDILTGDN